MSLGVLWVARHAPVTVANTCYGRADVPTHLAPEGAAELLAASFPAAPRATIWSSPVSRCHLPARHLAKIFGAAHRVDEALHEIALGAWEGLTWPQIAADHGPSCARGMDDWQSVAPPGGERPRDVEARARRWIAALDPRRTHGLVAHAGVVRALRVALEGRSWIEAMEIPVEHLAWSRFLFEKTAPNAGVQERLLTGNRGHE